MKDTQHTTIERTRRSARPAGGGGIAVRSYWFVSANSDVHPPAEAAGAEADNTLGAMLCHESPRTTKHLSAATAQCDRDIASNREFSYDVFVPLRRDSADTRRYDRVVLLFHGLNEKSWAKYVPWARRLVRSLGCPVVLFPIAFHMNRAPNAWADPREMIGVSHERIARLPGLAASSFANAALSHRVHAAPHRFVASGFQSYLDTLDLVRTIKRGEHELFAPRTHVDLFGYSIGALLAELLVMRNTDALFEESRAYLLCGGAVLDRTTPVSRAIIDDAASAGLMRFAGTLAANGAAALPAGSERIASMKPELELLTSMFFLDRLRDVREAAFRPVASRIRVATFDRDGVFPPASLRASWTDANGRPIVPVAVFDAPYDFRHEQPFPESGIDAETSELVQTTFTDVFDDATAFLARDTETGA